MKVEVTYVVRVTVDEDKMQDIEEKLNAAVSGLDKQGTVEETEVVELEDDEDDED